MLNHVVLIKFKDGAQDSQIDDLEKSLDALPDAIVEIHVYEFGRDILRSERSYDFAIVSLFANLEALKRYQTHPEHLKVLQKIKALSAAVVTVDFEGTDAGDFKEKTPGAAFLDR